MLKNILNSTVKYLLFFVILIVLVILNLVIWKKDYDQEQKIIALQKQLSIQLQDNDKIYKLNAKLHQKIDRLKQGSMEMIEEEARSGFGMVGEGETYYNFEDNEPYSEKP